MGCILKEEMNTTFFQDHCQGGQATQHQLNKLVSPFTAHFTPKSNLCDIRLFWCKSSDTLKNNKVSQFISSCESNLTSSGKWRSISLYIKVRRWVLQKNSKVESGCNGTMQHVISLLKARRYASQIFIPRKMLVILKCYQTEI